MKQSQFNMPLHVYIRCECSGVNCILGIMKEGNTHFEERQQQFDAFTVQPRGDKRKSNGLLSACSMGRWDCGGSWEEGSE